MRGDKYVDRHIGPDGAEVQQMLKAVGVNSVDALMEQVVPHDIRLPKTLRLPEAVTEQEYMQLINAKAKKNRVLRSLIGQGYYGTGVLPVVLRHVFENPWFYTSYTPYQAEISQGRLEAMLDYQTMVVSLTGLPLTNASLLDEATAAAEAMLMLFYARSREAVKEGRNQFFVDSSLFEHTVEVLKTRSLPKGIELVFGDYTSYSFTGREYAAIVQYPASNGNVNDYREFAQRLHQKGAKLVVAADLLSLVLLEAPGSWGADVVVGSAQRMGLPMGFGGPHAGYFATTEEYKRSIPGRIIGVTEDRLGAKALRLALQTREQHIRRERATSNICTAQALLATMAGMYAVYHGPEGLRAIATRVHSAAVAAEKALSTLGYTLPNAVYFDTLTIELPKGVTQGKVRELSIKEGFNFYYPRSENRVQISFDELSSAREVEMVVSIFAEAVGKKGVAIPALEEVSLPEAHRRTTPILEQEVFGKYRSEHEMTRYIHSLAKKDIALSHSMIPLGSCTMKLNPSVSMLPLSWPEFGNIHPFAPKEQAQGYLELLHELEGYLAEITGFEGCSLQANSGASGEYNGLLMIRDYHASRGEGHRDVALIPDSAHGTNPASAAMAGLRVVNVACDDRGNVDVEDLRKKAQEHAKDLCCFMVTYPSTHGVFESRIREMMDIVHGQGGQIFMDGANMNAQVGLTSPGYIGADVCHLNLHKTFAIPHGGGGPGVGPICVAKHLVPFLPGHVQVEGVGGSKAHTAVSSAPWGSAMVCEITYAYIRMLGAEGLRRASEIAILNANYVVARLKDVYGVVYTGETGRVGHEAIVDCRDCRDKYHVESGDIARRLMDYGFHAPTLSFPVHETLMVEPTESESKKEIDRFCDALIQIHREMEAIGEGRMPVDDNLLKNAPHPAHEATASEWKHPYSREEAVYPLEWLRENKYWPTVSRVDNAAGDRNLVCTCS